ncbi:polysaccharide biosynthesis/export family protein [Mucilaginibacter flavidus]|uniref:polysaccharide biosynthesis/export family protein n=1 Tax=Mucilaginibacter flavidus TaxID=2949309 RepID=UPI0020923070|nr:polysaccharide biosynthesis/export family protein [Mucilaginibacter flavidus]MCO5948033.1 polysaccharide biosynthesis/export family protein [Mucilaginibacter flavidus]
MKKNFPLPALIVLILFISSCGLYRDKGYKQVSYYQDVNRTETTEAITNFQPLKIQTGDLLGINVNSLSESSSVFNTSINRVNGNGLDAATANPIYGFRVDAAGQVQLPLVGGMHVAGLTTDDVAKNLTAKLQDYLKSPIVNVRVLNFKISVLGDVLKPDSYTIQNEHININEALSLAGDLTITAKRTNVLLVREENGQRHFVTIDLTKKDVFDSPYYYLHNNDVIYVDADKTKYDNVARSYKTNTFVISSAVAVLAILASAFFVYHK